MNNLLVEIEEVQKTKIGSIHLDPGFNPEQFVTTHGKVVALPEGYSKDYNNIAKEVEVGDTIYFHYLSVDDGARIPEPYNEGKKLYYIDYHSVFVAVRDGEIIPIGGWCVCEPVFEKEVETFELDGNTITIMIGENGLVESANPIHSEVFAKLTHIGTKLANQPDLDVKVGDRIAYLDQCDTKNEIDGKEVFIIHQEELTAVVVE